MLEPAVAAAVVVVVAAVVVVVAVAVLSVYCSCAGFEVWKKNEFVTFLVQKISLFPIKTFEL